MQKHYATAVLILACSTVQLQTDAFLVMCCLLHVHSLGLICLFVLISPVLVCTHPLHVKQQSL